MATNTDLRRMSETQLTDHAREKLAQARRLHDAARGRRMTEYNQRRFAERDMHKRQLVG